MGGRLNPLRVPPNSDEERALVRYAFRLLVGYAGGAAFVVGLLHLAGSLGAPWQALALLMAGGAAAASGIVGARTVLRDFGRADEQRSAQRRPMAGHNLGRRVG